MRRCVGSFLVLAVLGLGCQRAPAPPPTPTPPEVAVVTAQPASVPLEYEFVGMTEASQVVEIRARVPGFLLQRAFREGSTIKQGDLLFEIDPRTYQADLEIARASLAQAQARVQLAETDVVRYQEAVRTTAASQRELDLAQTSVLEARAAVSLAQAELQKAELNLSYTKILSPINGVIGRALKDVGTYIDAAQNSLLATATQIEPIYVTMQVSESDWLRWRDQYASGEIRPTYTQSDGSLPNPQHPDPPVRLVLLSGNPYPASGHLSFFDTRVDPQTGTATARAIFPNTESALLPGQFVRAIIYGWERPNSIVVPQRAVIQNPMGAMVMVVGEGNRVEPRPVTLGDWKGDGWLILTGLNGGEQVIADGFAKAPPGTVVKSVPFVPPANVPSPAPGSSSRPAGESRQSTGAPASATPPATPPASAGQPANTGAAAGGGAPR